MYTGSRGRENNLYNLWAGGCLTSNFEAEKKQLYTACQKLKGERPQIKTSTGTIEINKHGLMKDMGIIEWFCVPLFLPSFFFWLILSHS